MPYLVFDSQTGRCTGALEGAVEHFTGGVTVEVAAVPEDLSSWVLDAGGQPVQDVALVLSRAQAAKVADIKSQASAAIDATAWKLERAREREAAGWAALAAVDEVLALRESIRRSSNAAEARVLACTSLADVQAVTWTESDVAVPQPMRVTHAAFLDALRAQGESVIPAILAATDSNPALLQWWTYFDQSDYVAAGDARLHAGLQGLEFTGVLPAGVANQIIAALMGP